MTINRYNMFMLKLSAPLMTICRHLAGPIYRLLFPARLIGHAQLPPELASQPLIIASNHPSVHDPLQLIVHWPTNLHFLAKDELFHGPFGWFFRHLGLIPVDRNRHGAGLGQARHYLANHRTIAIFPEGTTKFKQSSQLLPFKYGAVRLARNTGATLLPVAITSAPQLFRRRTTINFGQPYQLPPDANLDQANRQLEHTILQLLRQAGITNVTLLPGQPARNPGQQPPTLN